MKLIDKQMIDQFIEVKKRGFEVCYSKNAIKNTREFHIIDELFSRMLLERNVNVAKHIIDETNLLANRTFDHEESLSYFKIL